MRHDVRTAVENLIVSQTVMVLAYVAEGKPYATTVFYVTPDRRKLYFKSRTESCHSQSLKHSNSMAAAIHDPASTYLIKTGVQITGSVELVDEARELRDAVRLYNSKFAGAEARMQPLDDLITGHGESSIYRLTIEAAKLVDGRQDLLTVDYESW